MINNTELYLPIINMRKVASHGERWASIFWVQSVQSTQWFHGCLASPLVCHLGNIPATLSRAVSQFMGLILWMLGMSFKVQDSSILTHSSIFLTVKYFMVRKLARKHLQNSHTWDYEYVHICCIQSGHDCYYSLSVFNSAISKLTK